jgi:hypothetical protein
VQIDDLLRSIKNGVIHVLSYPNPNLYTQAMESIGLEGKQKIARKIMHKNHAQCMDVAIGQQHFVAFHLPRMDRCTDDPVSGNRGGV